MSRLCPVALSVLLLCLGCQRPSEERAELDLQVGYASVAGVAFHVREGLAAVHTAASGDLRLWAQAPSLSIDVSSSQGATEEWNLVVSNCLSGTRLTTSTAGVAAQAIPSDSPTVCSFLVVIPAGTSTTLSLAPEGSESADPFVYAVLGDVQNAIDEVGDIFALMNADPELRFVACTGDLTSHGTTEQLVRVQQALTGLRIPLYSTVGNHELGGQGEWQQIFGRGSFHWTYQGSHFSFVDSASAGLDPLVYEWLEGWLSAGRASPHFFFSHFTPFDPVGTRGGAFRSSAEAAKLVALLAEGKADTAFFGHVHSYYAFSLGGVPAFISGGGGALPETMDGVGRHYLRVSVDPKQQTTEVALIRVD